MSKVGEPHKTKIWDVATSFGTRPLLGHVFRMYASAPEFKNPNHCWTYGEGASILLLPGGGGRLLISKHAGGTRMPATDLDFFPTILEAARIRYSHARTLDGESLIPLLLDPASFGTSRRHTEIPFLSHLGGSLVSRSGRYKLAIQDFSKARTLCRYTKLFDLETDPGEEFDLLKEGGSGSRARAKSMLKRYARWREDVYRSFLGYDYGKNTTRRVPFAPEDRKSFNAMTFDPNTRPQRPVTLDAWLGCGEGNAGCAPWGCP